MAVALARYYNIQTIDRGCGIWNYQQNTIQRQKYHNQELYHHVTAIGHPLTWNILHYMVHMSVRTL
jgi:hypothetical protein